MVFDYSDVALTGIIQTDSNGNKTTPNEQTYFDTRNNYRSFSYKYDFRLAGVAPSNLAEQHYRDGIYNWFGGKSAGAGGTSYGLNYAAGFFPTTPGATTGTFRIMEARGQVIVDSESTQKILSESAVVDLGTDWHNVIFVFDEDACAAFLYVDGNCVCAAWVEGMSMEGHDQVAIIRRMDVPCMIKGMAIGSTTAFFEAPEGYTVTCDGQVFGTFAEGATVTLPVPAAAENTRFFTWTGATVTRSAFNSANETANYRIYTMTMPAGNVTLTSEFVKVGDVDKDGNVTMKDISSLKAFIAGSVTYDDAQKEAADMEFNGAYNAKDISALKAFIAG